MKYWQENKDFVEAEFKRMGFDSTQWRISKANLDFELCESYPRFLIVPNKIDDSRLPVVAKFRCNERIPTAVWRHNKNGCFIVRTSQPLTSWFWLRNEADELLMKSYVEITRECRSNLKLDCSQSPAPSPKIAPPNQSNKGDNGHNNNNGLHDGIKLDRASNGNGVNGNGDKHLDHRCNDDNIHRNGFNGDKDDKIDETDLIRSVEALKFATQSLESNQSKILEETATGPNPTVNEKSLMVFLDARSYFVAMANRGKGGGSECTDYYPEYDVHYMNLANIHYIRRSFLGLKSVCETYSEQSNNWSGSLENSRWFINLAGLIKSALFIVDIIDGMNKSVVFHCSDGWDRTPQTISLAEIMLDPYYRTMKGFKTLVQREWLDFGHKFAERCGVMPSYDEPCDRCPIFLQWLDCVHQLMIQFPNHFEFNSEYLQKLNKLSYANVFGTFAFNSLKERYEARDNESRPCVWEYLECNKKRFKNDCYNKTGDILRPLFEPEHLHFWNDVYTPLMKTQVTPYNLPTSSEPHHQLLDSFYINSSTKEIYRKLG